MICKETGCNYPEGECSGACIRPGALPHPMLAAMDKEVNRKATLNKEFGKMGAPALVDETIAAALKFAAAPASALDTQEGGDHYKKLGVYQPWEVLRAWLTPEEFRGYMKGTAIAYLARERDKGGMLDVRKSAHTLQALIEMLGDANGS